MKKVLKGLLEANKEGLEMPKPSTNSYIEFFQYKKLLLVLGKTYKVLKEAVEVRIIKPDTR